LATGYGEGTFSINTYADQFPTDTTADSGADMLIGTAAVNNIIGQGGDDVLVGLANNDTLDGGAGADLLLAGDGNDELTGGTQIDVLAGGRGADTYNFAATDANADGVPTTNADYLVDYSFVEGDKLDLSDLLDTNFEPSSSMSDFVRLQTSGSNVVVQVDTDGTAGGATWADVATLANYATSNLDIVGVHFESTNHTLII
jgi:Ca2+-binding RTX toxin-like protein